MTQIRVSPRIVVHHIMSISLDEIQTRPQQLLGYDLQHTLMVSFGMVILGFTSLPHYIEKYRKQYFPE